MQAIVLTDVGKLERRDVPNAAITGDRDVLLRIDKVGVCGSDVHYYETGRIGSQIVQFPFILGHECSATVVETAPGVTRVQVGGRVAVDPAIICHDCDQCRRQRPNTCRHLRFLGCPGQADGCLCEYLVMPQECVYPLPAAVSQEQAVLCEPLSIGIYAVRQAQLTGQADLAVLGAGPIGLSVVLAARAAGHSSICVTDKIDERVRMAQRVGACWAGNPDQEDVVAAMDAQQPAGMDAVFECAGEQDALDQAVDLLKPGGRLMLVGIPRQERISFVIDRLRRKEITIINVRRQSDCVQRAIDMIAEGAVNVDFMITHRFARGRTAEAFDLVADYRDGVVKALIEF